MKKISTFSRLLKNGKTRATRVLVATVALTSTVFVSAQVSAYQFSQSVGTFVPNSSSATILGSGTLDSVVYPVTLPFSFFFNGNSYTQLNVSSNGFVTFGATAPSTILYKPISGTAAYEGAISAFGRDLNGVSNVTGVTSNINWEVVGTAPNREAVIQWTNWRPMYNSSSTNAYTFNFQIRLSENGGGVKIVYTKGSYLAGSTAIAPTSTTGPEIGLRGSTNADYNNRTNSTTELFTNSAAGSANTAMQFFDTLNSPPGMPSDGLTYAWTPSTCYPPSAIYASNITATTATVTWSAPAVGSAQSYDLYYSTSSTVPSSSTVPTLSGLTGTTANLGTPTPLIPSTPYYVWMRTKCSATEFSAWSMISSFTTLCEAPILTGVTGDTVCVNGVATLSASSAAGNTIKWYDSATSTTPVGTGNTFSTAPLTSTTNYWVSVVGNTAIKSVGPANPSFGSVSGSTGDYYMYFTVNDPLTIKTIDIYPATAGQTGAIEIINATSNTVVASVPVTTAAASTTVPQQITFNQALVPGNYIMKRTNSMNLNRNSTGASYPYSVPELSITASNFTTSAVFYYFFYNWQIETGCESARQQVTATVDMNCLSTSEVAIKDGIKVYPNPFVDVVNISNFEEVKSAQVLDLAGRVVKTIEKITPALSLSELKNGMYLLNLNMKNGKTQTVKIIKK